MNRIRKTTISDNHREELSLWIELPHGPSGIKEQHSDSQHKYAQAGEFSTQNTVPRVSGAAFEQLLRPRRSIATAMTLKMQQRIARQR